jgi:hypothetical protein
LIYNRDTAIRKAYATFLTRNGIPADSCGTLSELVRLLSWYAYDFVLVNIDNLHADQELQQSNATLDEIVQRYQLSATIIVTSNNPNFDRPNWPHAWVLREPLTPRVILTAISEIRGQQSYHGDKKEYLKLRQYLSRPIAP